VKIVADTTVLVSALIFPGGAPEAVYRLALEGHVRLVSSRPLLAELGRVLTDKFGWETERAQDAVAQIVRFAEIVEPLETVRVVEAEPADDRVLEAAAEAGAEAIVSGDRHLLALGSWNDVAVQTPAAFLAAFAER
jgi:uncharacterized protein